MIHRVWSLTLFYAIHATVSHIILLHTILENCLFGMARVRRNRIEN